MALVTQFDTPASVRDLPLGSSFYSDWHNFLAAELSTVNGGGTGLGSKFYDASELDITPVAAHILVWMSFPRSVLVAHRDNRTAAYTDAENDLPTRNAQDEYSEWYVH